MNIVLMWFLGVAVSAVVSGGCYMLERPTRRSAANAMKGFGAGVAVLTLMTLFGLVTVAS